MAAKLGILVRLFTLLGVMVLFSGITPKKKKKRILARTELL